MDIVILALGISYLIVSFVEYLIPPVHRGPFGALEHWKQLFMALVGILYVWHSGLMEFVFAASHVAYALN
ncbi:MAG: hypothetical protein KGI75_14020 [Rhizobiaceae bacterium]|nr:hypothetical protein [Rhizobiaceae bacterium]